MKKTIKAIGICVMCLALLFVFVLFIAPVADERAAVKYKNKMVEQLEMYKEITVISAKSGCVNTGNGDHTEMIACVLIKTELTKEETEKLLDKNAACVRNVDDFDNVGYIERAGIFFNDLEKNKGQDRLLRC